jgi:predicted PurR-regulated permease PerM
VADTRFADGWQRFFVSWGSILLTIAFLYWARAVLIPVVLAVLLTFVLAPLVGQLQRHGLGRISSALLVLVLACALVAGIGFVVLHQVSSLVAELPHHKEQIVQKIRSLQESARGSWLEKVSDTLQEINQEIGTAGWQEPTPVRLETSSFWTMIESAVTPAAEVLVNVGLVVILVGFMLIQRESLRNRIIRLWSHGNLASMTRAIDDAAQRLSRYLLMQLLINVGFGATLGIGLFLIGVPYAFLWGFLAGALRYIPYLGPWIAAALLVLVSVVMVPGWTAPLLVFGLIVVLELVCSNILEPRLYGQSIGASEVALLIAAAFWAWLWGPIGLMLSAPLTACLVVVGRYVPQMQGFSILLGDEPALEPYVTYYQRLLARDEYEATELVEDYIEKNSVEKVCEDILVPALVLAQRSRERGEVSAEDQQFILQTTQELIEDNLPSLNNAIGSAGRAACLLAYPARDEADRLALEILGRLLAMQGLQFEVVSHEILFAQLAERIEEEHLGAMVILCLSTGGVPHARYLCKRLRAQFEELKIVVACWGLHGGAAERARKQFQRAGADHVGFSLPESRDQLIPLLQFLAHVPEEAAGSVRR